jgi:hypothetical protein
LFLLSVESSRIELAMVEITSWECSIDGILQRGEIENERASPSDGGLHCLL